MPTTPTVLQLIQALEAQTQPNTINPVSIGTILRAINTIVDAANTTSQQAQGTALTASQTATQALNTINASQAAVNAQVLAQLQTLLNTVNARTQLAPTTYGDKRQFAYDDLAIPYYNDNIDFTLGYTTIAVKIGGTQTTTFDIDLVKPGTCFTAIIECSGDTDFDKVIQNHVLYGKMRLLSDKDMYSGRKYEMKVYRVIDTTQYSAYDASKVEILITIKQL